MKSFPIPFIRSWDGMPWCFEDTVFLMMLTALLSILVVGTVMNLTSHHHVRYYQYHCVQTKKELVCTRR